MATRTHRLCLICDCLVLEALWAAHCLTHAFYRALGDD
jgi:hypothetical protein